MRMASKAMANAAVSVNMCAASEISARLCVTMPPINSTSRKAVVNTSAMVSERCLAPAV